MYVSTVKFTNLQKYNVPAKYGYLTLSVRIKLVDLIWLDTHDMFKHSIYLDSVSELTK